MKKIKIMDKPIYLDPSILKLSKTVMYVFWFNYVKPKYDKKQNCVTWIQIAL